MRAGLAGDRSGLNAAATDIGFVSDAVADGHRAQILDMMVLVFDALKAAPEYDFADQSLSEKMQRMGLALAEDGFVPPPLPMDALFLQRKFAGMFLLAARLKARVPVTAMIERWL